MGFIASLIIALVLMVVGEILRPKQKPMNAKASSIDDFSVPTAEEGRSIPIFCGKVKIDGSNVTWYGDLLVTPLKKRVKTGLWSSTKQTYAHQYRMGMQMVLGHSRADMQIHEILFGDKMPKYTRTDEANGVVKFAFDDIDFFGGNQKEGGIQGTVRVYRGYDTQEPSAYFSSKIGETAPGYRGLAYAMLEQTYLGTSPYIKTISYIVSSYPNTLGVPSNHHKIGDDANPVCFIYEICNDPKWGLNINAGRFNLAGWRAAAETCFAEGYGISMIINGGSSGEDLIAEVLRHIDGVIYTDPQTGLLEFKLARADYDPETLPVFGPDDFNEGIKFSRPSWSQTKNTIKVTYVDRSANYTEAVVSQQDLSNITQREGEIYAEEIPFMGFSTFAAADRACARALKTLSYPLAKVSGSLSRRAWTMRPGSVFKLNWPARGLNGVVMRVIRIDYGNLRQNTIDIEAVEDIFSISQSAYVQPPPSGWVDPIQPPSALVTQTAVELAYGIAPFQGNAYVAALAARNTGIDEGYDIWSNRATTGVAFRTRNYDWTPTGTLIGTYAATTAAYDTVGFSLNNMKHAEDIDATATDDEVTGGNRVAVIVSAAGEEYIAYKNAPLQVDGTLNVTHVVRGIYDTVPLTHPPGGRVWFLSEGYGLENEDAPYLTSQACALQLLPFNVRGILPLASAPIINLTVGMRCNKPYPPANMKIDGNVNPPTVTGSATFTWSLRHRVTQGNLAIRQDAANTVTTPEGSIRVRVYIDGAVRRTVDIVSAPYDTFDYTTTMRAADYANVQKPVTFGIQALNGALTSVERMTGSFYMVDLLSPLAITSPASLPVVTLGSPYSVTLTPAGGTGIYTWSISAGSLPAGFSLNPSTGVISGSTAVSVNSTFTVRLDDNISSTPATRIYTLTDTVTLSDKYETTGAEQTYIVPSGVTSLRVHAIGAGGGGGLYSTGGASGAGGYSKGTISVTPGETLKIRVGEGGKGGRKTPSNQGGGTAYPGGGNGAWGDTWGGGGGGYTGIFRNDGTPLVIAGAGGGGSGYSTDAGAGGGTTGGNGNTGTGGTQSAGGTGAYPGSAYQGGNANGGNNTTSTSFDSGGGGGGYYGGGASNGDGHTGSGGSGYIGGASSANTYAGTNINRSVQIPPYIRGYATSSYGLGVAGTGSGTVASDGGSGVLFIYEPKSLNTEILADSPTWFCKHEETSGTTATNLASGGANGTYGGTPVLGANPIYVDGGTCWDLNNASHCDIPSSVMPASTTAITLEILMKRKASIAGTQALIDRDNEGVDRRWQWRFESGSDDLSFIKIIGAIQTATANDVGPANSTAIFAVTVDVGGNAKIYKNGQQVGTATFTGGVDYGTAANGLRIGRRIQGDSQGDYYCAVSAVYTSALSAARLLEHAKAAGLA